MSGSLDGYLTRSPYALTTQTELSPAWLDQVALQAGYAPPRARPGDPFTYCDLGCGQGLTATLLAAAVPSGRFLGLDAMATHTAVARERAKSLGLKNLRFRRDTFEGALKRDYGPFDYIVCHGVYTWVSEQNRRALVAFVERFLKPGGLLYLGYNALPGWNGSQPLQRLLLEVARTRPKAAPTKQFDAGARLIAEMREAQAVSLHRDPRVDYFLSTTVRQSPSYLVHEYLHDGWEPVYGADVETVMRAAGLIYAGSTRFLENREDFFLRKSQRALLDRIKDRALRSLVRDHFIGQSFRTDIFIRDAKRLRRDTAWKRRLEAAIAPALPPGRITCSLKTSAGTLSFDNEAAKAILDSLSSGPKSIREIAQSCVGSAITEADLLNTVDALLAGSQCVPVDPAAPGARVTELNGLLRRQALKHELVRAQASPHGALIDAGRLELLLLDRSGGLKQLEEFILARLAKAGLPMTALLPNPADHKRPKSALRAAIRIFVREQRTFFQGLGI